METCRSCKAEVVFVPSAKSGKSMILDAAGSKHVVIVHREDDLVLAPVDDPDARARIITVYTDHHATCPNAADWKGRRR